MYDPTLPPGYQDADLEMAELAQPAEPPCPCCGEYDTMISRYSNVLKDAARARVAARNSLNDRDVIACYKCDAKVHRYTGKVLA